LGHLLIWNRIALMLHSPKPAMLTIFEQARLCEYRSRHRVKTKTVLAKKNSVEKKNRSEMGKRKGQAYRNPTGENGEEGPQW